MHGGAQVKKGWEDDVDDGDGVFVQIVHLQQRENEQTLERRLRIGLVGNE